MISYRLLSAAKIIDVEIRHAAFVNRMVLDCSAAPETLMKVRFGTIATRLIFLPARVAAAQHLVKRVPSSRSLHDARTTAIVDRGDRCEIHDICNNSSWS